MRPGYQAHDPEYLDLDHIFPQGYLSFKLSQFPTTSYPLFRNLRIFVSHMNSSDYNNSIQSLFGQSWIGEIVVAKYAKGEDNQEAIQVLPYELDLLNVIIGM